MSEVISSPAAMFAKGVQIGELLRPGDLVILAGGLGAGKTLFTQGVGQALGIKGITSPTFVISRNHHGKFNLTHVDAYRLTADPAALFDDLDLETQLEKGIVVVEWGEGFAERLSDEYLLVRIDYGSGDSERVISFQGFGSRWKEVDL